MTMADLSNTSPQTNTTKDECFSCKRKGHWSQKCPNKTPKTSPSASPSIANSELPTVRYPLCLRLIRLRTSESENNPGRQYFSCALQGKSKCRFFRWFDELGSVVDEVPMCPCGAGLCTLNLASTNVYSERWYYKCRIKENFGDCKYFKWADSEVNTLNTRRGHARKVNSIQSVTDIANNELNEKENDSKIRVETVPIAENSPKLPVLCQELIPNTDIGVQGGKSLDVVILKALAALQDFELMAQLYSSSSEALWRTNSDEEKSTTGVISSNDVDMSDAEGQFLLPHIVPKTETDMSPLKSPNQDNQFSVVFLSIIWSLKIIQMCCNATTFR